MATQKTGNVSNQREKVSPARGKKAKRACPSKVLLSVTAFTETFDIADRMMRYYRITYKSLRALLFITRSWVTYRVGVTASRLATTLYSEDSGTTLRALQMILQGLVAKGLIEVLGNSPGKAFLYVPTAKLLIEMDRVCGFAALVPAKHSA